ncbi:dethiobiotin synthase [Chitinophaga nivalis]|uniref:ATP-dependent dethiobiotin synthetase BioD n=1 Tax=Chitinophaga nivalis TaxID=2991709 RepID=A0ABT3ILT7_9BACT|nr:dethiobiotin synthase [Chitinophaga nivalis]MCW3465380.1 dethiobiotin synthase [Chitinophaga nivalis]MCW3484928.1 dethiobiotin synthase [Chitinophaga nivalis]
MSERIFITGIGTGVGKTIAAACITEALQADYWKPIQSGLAEGTDTETVSSLLSGNLSVCHPEAWRLQEPASPHLAARMEGVTIDISRIITLAGQYQPATRALVIEGAGGLLVPVNDHEFTVDLIRQLKARVIIVAQNYLGSINHALLTARVLQQERIPVAGWVFGGDWHSNEEEVVQWSGYPKIGRIPLTNHIDKAFVKAQAQLLTAPLHSLLA